MAPLYMVLVPVRALYGTWGCAAVQQASTSCCKDVHPYNSPALNNTKGITMGFYAPTQIPAHTHSPLVTGYSQRLSVVTSH